jgi:hypothetical protein
VKDLEEAVQRVELALKLTLDDCLYRTVCLNDLGNKLECRYKRTGEIKDLDEAIEVAKLAVKSTLEDHLD